MMTRLVMMKAIDSDARPAGKSKVGEAQSLHSGPRLWWSRSKRDKLTHAAESWRLPAEPPHYKTAWLKKVEGVLIPRPSRCGGTQRRSFNPAPRPHAHALIELHNSATCLKSL